MLRSFQSSREIRFKYIADFQKGKIPSELFETSGENRLPYLAMEYIRNQIDSPQYASTQDTLVASENDVLLLWDGANAGEFLQAKNGIVSSTAALVKPKGINKQFFFYLCKFLEPEIRIQTVGMGIPHVNGDFVENLVVQIPDEITQAKISDFLDERLSNLDSLITFKERLLELLAEKRAIIINQVVTKGLNPDVKMKASGVAWLGYVPSHWEVKRLKHISPSQSVGLVINPSSYVTDEGVPFLYGGDISEGHISIENARRISPENSKLLEQSMLRTGDLVMVRVGYPGITAVVPEYLDGSNCASMMIVRRHPSFISDWLCYVMNSRASRAQVESVQYGAAQKQFNISHAVEFIYPLPPIEEQKQIVKYLDYQTKRLTNLATKIKTVIALLHERRASLIAAAVSGQIKVM